MLIQCALNGRRTRAGHPAVPVTPAQLAADAVACWAAGARSVHLHPRRPGDGLESLAASAHDAAVAAVRAAVPEMEVSCSTQQDIDLGGASTRIDAVRAWTQAPDLVSLNLVQEDAVELGLALLDRGIGIEAGVFSLEDADALLAAPWAALVRRVLVEIIDEEDDGEAAVALAHEIDAQVASLGRPRLWHGHARATWAVVAAGRALGRDVRVGFEDTLVDPDGRPSQSNAQQVLAVEAGEARASG
jgi:uncharacterized protein (DUF849 family)